jgi:hypothetical protein
MKSSPSSSMELKFELDTRLIVSCVVAVASAYGLVTVSIMHDSILLAFGNNRHPFVDSVHFVWLERALGRAQQEKVHGELEFKYHVTFLQSFEFSPDAWWILRSP